MSILEMFNSKGQFTDIVSLGDQSLQLEMHRRFCCRKRGDQTPREGTRLGRHQSQRSHRDLVIWWNHGCSLYCEIIQETLLPFLASTYPEHRFMQDNDPKHASRKAQAFFQEHEVNWWKIPAESPDMNPIENLWYELKEWIHTSRSETDH